MAPKIGKMHTKIWDIFKNLKNKHMPPIGTSLTRYTWVLLFKTRWSKLFPTQTVIFFTYFHHFFDDSDDNDLYSTKMRHKLIVCRCYFSLVVFFVQPLSPKLANVFESLHQKPKLKSGALLGNCDQKCDQIWSTTTQT